MIIQAPGPSLTLPETMTPFAAALLLRNYVQALQDHNLLALEIEAENLRSKSAAAEYFARLQTGIPRCESRPTSGCCTNDGAVAITAHHDPALLDIDAVSISCLQHLKDSIPNIAEHIRSLSGQDGLLCHWAFRLQAAQRRLKHSPEPQSEHNLIVDIRTFQRHLKPPWPCTDSPCTLRTPGPLSCT